MLVLQVMVYFLRIGLTSLQGLLLYSSKWRKISDIDNYCPLSVISIIGKVFERIIYYQLFANLLDRNILSKHQSGIHVLHSAVTAFNQRPVILIQVTLTLLLFLTLRKHKTKSIMISYCLNYIFLVYQVLPVNAFSPI